MNAMAILHSRNNLEKLPLLSPPLSLSHPRTYKHTVFMFFFSPPPFAFFLNFLFVFVPYIPLHTELLDAWIEMLVKFIFENDFFFLNLVENFLGV